MKLRSAALVFVFPFGLALAASLDASPGYANDQVQVPADRMPPPGLCRAWFQDRPPERQPASGPCDILRAHLPEGAVLLDGGPGPGGRYAQGIEYYKGSSTVKPGIVYNPAADGSSPHWPYCREFPRQVSLGEPRERAHGVACQQPDGSWKVIR